MSNKSKKKKTTKLPIDPQRIRAFANFFKRYMGVSSLITAALPIPVTAFQLIPTYSKHTKILSVYTSLFCFLILAFIFFSRQKLARVMFPDFYSVRYTIIKRSILIKWKFILINTLPFLLIVASLTFLLIYHYAFEEIFGLGTVDMQAVSSTFTTLDSIVLLGTYLGIFITAEAAFILMAIKEYLQDLLGLTDLQIIEGPKRRQD